MWLAIYVPSLPLQALSRLISQTVPALVFETQGRRDVVIACNRSAMELGVKRGSNLAEAIVLGDQFVVLPRDLQREAECLQHLASALAGLTPNIHISDNYGLLLDVAASRLLNGNYANLLQIASSIVDAHGIRAHQVLAPTSRGARWLGKAHRQLLVEKDIDDWLDDLPVRCMDISDGLLKALEEFNLPYLSSLKSLTGSELNQRLGTELTTALDQAYGRVTQTLPFWRTSPDFHQYVDFLDLVSNQQHWWPGVVVLLRQLQEYLRLHSKTATSLTFLFANGQQQNSPIMLASDQGEHRTDTWLQLLQAHLERQPILHEISRIDLHCTQLKPAQVNESDFFDRTQTDQSSWQSLLDLLSSRLGLQHLLTRPHEQQNALPDSRTSTSTSSYQPDSDVIRPCWLVDPPRRLYGDRLRRLRHSLIRRQPERIEAQWAELPAPAATPQRDYYIAAGEHHAYWWIYRERSTDQWFLQGIFA